jgi:ATP-binding cassette subfamily F protein 3
MSLVSLENISLSFGPHDILTGLSCEANQGERIGLVGRNGAGKTSLLHVLAGLVKPTSGKRHLARNTRVALVEQAPPTVGSAATVTEEVLSGIGELLRLERDLESLGQTLAEGDAADEKYDDLLSRFEAAGGFSYQSRLAQILTGLGLHEDDWEKPLGVLSGGQRSRVALARALLAEPDLLLMDEPTNHLDLAGLQWLEGFLKRWRGTVVVSSHDRYFLDNVANWVWHVENGRLKSYPGNYSQFEALLDAEVTRQRKQHEAQQEVIEKEEAFIRRYRAGSRAREARGRAKKLARLQRIEAPVKSKATRLTLGAKRSADLVLSTSNLDVGYGDLLILQAGDLEVVRGARVALLGPNGAGKTTLLKTIAGELSPIAGSLRLGEGVVIAHYWQEAENLDDGATVLEELLSASSLRLQEARDLLGRFLFSGDDVNKKVGVISGGERGRLALAKIVVSGANLLLLDEPTNHLDISSRQALEDALESYAGTFIFASHDRRLIARLATELWIIEGTTLRRFEGSWDEYNRTDSRPQTDAADTGKPSVKSATRAARGGQSQRDTARARKALIALEQEIAAQEQLLAELTESIEASSARADVGALAELGLRFEDTQGRLDALLSEWAALGDE